MNAEDLLYTNRFVDTNPLTQTPEGMQIVYASGLLQNNQIPENAGIQSDQDDDIKDKEDNRPFMRDQSKNPGSFFSPLIPKKPTVPNVKPPDNPVNKGPNTDGKEDPNKNLNTDSDKKS